MVRLKRMLAAAVAGAAAVATTAAQALAQTPPPIPLIQPHQYFAGEVNGNIAASTLAVEGCTPSSTGSGELVGGQTVSARYFPVPPPVAYGTHFLGYSGAADSISVQLEVSRANPPLSYLVNIADLTAYDTPASFPVHLTVPCDATFTALFTPDNGGPAAITSQVALTLTAPAITPSVPTARPGELIQLAGSGFVPNTSLALAECAKTNWIAPQDPCDTSNQITVTTDASGSFDTAFVIETCPVPTAGATMSCYLGEPVPTGVDTIALIGAARITVL